MYGRVLVWTVTLAAGLGSFGIGNALGQLQRSALERLTGAPASIVTPLKERIDVYTVPPGWTEIALPRRVVTTTEHLQKVVLTAEPGGLIHEHYLRFQAIADRGQMVEVRGACMSACTVLMSVLRRDAICFGPKALLAFHQAEYGEGPNKGKPRPDATWAMFARYPPDIQAWITSKGGPDRLPHGFPLWVLTAEELWKMGYRKCTD